MSHPRGRYLHDLLTPTIKWSPTTGVIGLRQVGKTTLVKTLADEFHGEFVTLDDESSLNQSRDRPAEFLTRRGLLCIDEVQLSPGNARVRTGQAYVARGASHPLFHAR